jgi:hypothetical protein
MVDTRQPILTIMISSQKQNDTNDNENDVLAGKPTHGVWEYKMVHNSPIVLTFENNNGDIVGTKSFDVR